MNSEQIQFALADITAETDPPLKHLKLASLVSAVFRKRLVELVVVGGAAIEFYTEGPTPPETLTYACSRPHDSTPARARN